MHARVLTRLAAASLVLGAALPARAEPGAATFEAVTSTTIAPGGSVTFAAIFTKAQDWFGTSYTNPEPLPAAGEQVWQISGESETQETLSSLSFDIWSTSGEGLGIAVPIKDGGPGSLVSNTDSFSLVFATPGIYSVTLNGGWQSLASTSDMHMTGTRTCLIGGTGVLECSAWQLVGVGGSALTDTSGSFGPITLQVQVVPEPATTLLWLLGLGAVGGLMRHRRRRDRAASVSPR